MAARLHDRGIGAQVREQLNRQSRRTPYILISCGIHADGGQLDQLAQEILEARADRFDVSVDPGRTAWCWSSSHGRVRHYSELFDQRQTMWC